MTMFFLFFFPAMLVVILAGLAIENVGRVRRARRARRAGVVRYGPYL